MAQGNDDGEFLVGVNVSEGCVCFAVVEQPSHCVVALQVAQYDYALAVEHPGKEAAQRDVVVGRGHTCHEHKRPFALGQRATIGINGCFQPVVRGDEVEEGLQCVGHNWKAVELRFIEVQPALSRDTHDAGGTVSVVGAHLHYHRRHEMVGDTE